MSRQAVMNKKGHTLGFIETDYDGTQSAMTPGGKVLGLFDPRTNQTFDPSGRNLGEGNGLPGLVRQHG